MAYTFKLSCLDFCINGFTELFEIKRFSTSYIMKYYFTYPGVPICLKAIKLSSRKKNQRSMLEANIAMYIINFQPENNPFTRK